MKGSENKATGSRPEAIAAAGIPSARTGEGPPRQPALTLLSTVAHPA